MKNNFLFADIGNTNIDFLFQKGEEYLPQKILSTKKEELIHYLDSLDFVKECYISSVDRVACECLISCLKEKEIPYQVIDSNVIKEFAANNGYVIENADILGADLFCDALCRDTDKGLIVVDLGTANKILYLDSKKRLNGGCIFPGITFFPETLHMSTDLLGLYSLERAPKLVSLDTSECISSGAINGIAALIAGMVHQIKKEYECPDALVVLTGGNGYLIKDVLPRFGLEDFETDINAVHEGLARTFGFTNYLSMKQEIKTEEKR